MDLAVPADHIVKIKEIDIDLARELKKIWNMTMIVIPMIPDAHGTIPRGVVTGLEELEF